MTDRFGAEPKAWDHYISLGLTRDLLPVMSNPNAAISPRSKMKGLGKTPSRYNSQRQAVGIAEWTGMTATAAQVASWAKEPDYGICIQTRRLRAIDIDVDDRDKNDAIVALIWKTIGQETPRRLRCLNGRSLLVFWHEAPLPKHVIPVDGGIIEILADGQQFVAEGTHPDGTRYEWSGDWSLVPTLDEVDFAMLLAELREMATGPVRIAREKRKGSAAVDLEVHDDVADWLIENWEVHDAGTNNELFIRCPFEREHTTDSGPSSTAYFPAGTGGYEQGHFVCLHAHCTGRGDSEFLGETGYAAAQFEGLGSRSTSDQASEVGKDTSRRETNNIEQSEETQSLARTEGQPTTWPRLTRDGQHRIEPTMNNLLKSLACPEMVERYVAHDGFKDELVWAPAGVPRDQAQWRPFRDSDYALVRQQLELRGFKPMGQEMLRLAILTVAEQNEIDTAIEWLQRLEWDGTPRVERFCADIWGWEETPYAIAVSRYVWTALAGRVMQPGVRADMAPILVGEQGIKKTTAIQMLAPNEEFYVEIKFDSEDDNQARLLRGKLVGELGELRGLNSRAIEDIKTFITRRYENWVPKYREFSTRFMRRVILFGTTNEDEILADPTGERRWLPGLCINKIDIRKLLETRDQLWAEGRTMFEKGGVDWQDAELLAKVEHTKFKVTDAWAPYVMRWLRDENATVSGSPMTLPYITTGDALTGAIGVQPNHIDHSKNIRMGKVLRSLGFKRRKHRTPEGFDWGFERD